MRFLIKLHINKSIHGNILPINYQYELSSAIYKMLSISGEEYATWLHNNGYQHETGKVFKMFCFSRLHFDKSKVIKGSDRLMILSDYASCYISFLSEIGTNKFIEGIFTNREFDLGDRKSKVRFEVSNIEALNAPELKETMEYCSISPIVIRQIQEDGRKKYLSPTDDIYANAIKNGLKSRYEAFYGKLFDFDIEFELLTDAKSSLVTLKVGTPNETKVRGFNYSFKIKAPIEIQKMIYEVGIGELCSQGFGCVGEK